MNCVWPIERYCEIYNCNAIMWNLFVCLQLHNKIKFEDTNVRVWEACNRQQDTGSGKLSDFLSRHHCLPPSPSCQPRISMRGMHVIPRCNFSLTYTMTIIALSYSQLSPKSFHVMCAFTEKESGTFSRNTVSHADGAGCAYLSVIGELLKNLLFISARCEYVSYIYHIIEPFW